MFTKPALRSRVAISNFSFTIFNHPRRHPLNRHHLSTATNPPPPFSTSITTTPLSTGGHIAHLSFRGPKKFPILGPDALRALTSTIQGLSADANLRGLFLRSTIAGADLAFMRSIPAPNLAQSFIRLIDRLCAAIQAFPHPVVAVCRGPCLGAGLEVAMAADLRVAVAAPDTVFGMPETKVGIPSVVQACLLPGLVGWSRAREMLYFGETINCAKARRWGLVDYVVRAEELELAIQVWEQRIAETGVNALKAQKALMSEWMEKGCGREGVEAGVRAFGKAFESDEPRRMMDAFFAEKEKRKKQREIKGADSRIADA